MNYSKPILPIDGWLMFVVKNFRDSIHTWESEKFKVKKLWKFYILKQKNNFPGIKAIVKIDNPHIKLKSKDLIWIINEAITSIECNSMEKKKVLIWINEDNTFRKVEYIRDGL